MKVRKIKVTLCKCSNCGTNVEEEDVFCRMCGNRFSDEVVTSREEQYSGVNDENKPHTTSLSPLIENN